MKTQDLKKQLLNVVSPVDFSEKPLDLLQKFARDETDETLRQYLLALLAEVKPDHAEPDSLNKLREAEHDMLCRLIQIYFNDETEPVFKRYLTVVCLFSDYVTDIKLLLNILNYYDIFNKKLY